MSKSDLPLRGFRNANGFSLDDLSGALGVHKTTAMRIELGELPADADVVERIETFTTGLVTAADMHAIRLAWLKANRPEKFREAPPSGLPAISPSGGEIRGGSVAP